LVGMCKFFFVRKRTIAKQYRNFFESEDEDRKDAKTPEEDTTKIPASQSAARFYFELTYQLAKEDLTKIERINELNMYLCLNAASLIKDRAIAQENELKKLKKNIGSR
jgi:hypothetical protein